MIGVIIMGHGKLPESLVEAVTHVTGPQPSLLAINIFPQDDMREHRKDFLKSIEKMDQGKGVIVVTDLFGGTPSNLALSVLNTCPTPIEVIAGVNLPLLVQLMIARKTLSLSEVAQSAQAMGKKYIQIASSLLEIQRHAVNS